MSLVKFCKCNIFESSEFPGGISSILLLQFQLQAQEKRFLQQKRILKEV